MKNSFAVLFAFAVVIGLSSCAHNCGSCSSLNYRTNIILQGFADSEVTPLTLYSYVKGSNFTAYRGDTTFTNLANGTTTHGILIIANDSIDLLVAPSHLQAYQVTNMHFALTSCNDCPQSNDVNLLSSYNLNGIQTTGLGVVIQK